MNLEETVKLTDEEVLKAAKLLLVEETKKNFRLKDAFAEQFGKEFDEKEIEEEINEKRNTHVDGSSI